MGKPVNWKRLIKRAVAKAALSRPNELSYFFLHEISFHQLLMLIRASLASEKYPEPTKQDIQNLSAVFPLPDKIQKEIKANSENYEEVSFLFALQALMAETVQGLLDYIWTWAQPDIDRLTADYDREFSERNIEEKQSMDESEKAVLQQELDEAYERDDRYQIYWLRRYMDSGLPAEHIELDRRTAPKLLAVLQPVIEQFASAVPPSMSGQKR